MENAKMKIYVASSWRNVYHQSVVDYLRRQHESLDVYNFRQPTAGDDGFHWREVDPEWKAWRPEYYRQMLDHELCERGFRYDMDALRESDACILVLPAGTSSHLELGWSIGAGKLSAILFPFGFDVQDVPGHVQSLGGREQACPGCGDIDGCHLPGKLHRVEPELMNKMAGNILIGRQELAAWVNREVEGKGR